MQGIIALEIQYSYILIIKDPRGAQDEHVI
jgi:hypothetical protein